MRLTHRGRAPEPPDKDILPIGHRAVQREYEGDDEHPHEEIQMGSDRRGGMRFAVLGWALAGPLAVQAQPQDSESSLRAADEAQRAAVAARDVDGATRLSHPNLIINGPSGRVITREAFIEQVRTGEIGKERFQRFPEAVRITDDIGVVLGREVVVGAPGSRDFQRKGSTTFERRYTNIYRFEGGRWLLLARQASIVSN